MNTWQNDRTLSTLRHELPASLAERLQNCTFPKPLDNTVHLGAVDMMQVQKIVKPIADLYVLFFVLFEGWQDEVWAHWRKINLLTLNCQQTFLWKFNYLSVIMWGSPTELSDKNMEMWKWVLTWCLNHRSRSCCGSDALRSFVLVKPIKFSHSLQ